MTDTASEFTFTNHDVNSARFQQKYKIVEAGSDTFHVYQSGDVELVVETESHGPNPVLATGTLPAAVDPATASPHTVAAAVPDVSVPSGPSQSPVAGSAGPLVAPGGSATASGAVVAPGAAYPMAANPMAQPTAIQPPPVSQVQPLTPPIGPTNPDVTLGQLEPGLVWGIRQGLINPDTLGPHIVKLLEGE